jgi:hypothetical protein
MVARILVAMCAMSAVAVADSRVPPVDAVPSSVPSSGARDRDWVLGAAVLGATGVVAIGSGVLLGLSAHRQYEAALDRDCDSTSTPPRCNPTGFEETNQAVMRGKLATGMLVAGAVFAGAGAVMYVMAPKERFAVAPSVGADGAGVTLSGRF